MCGKTLSIKKPSTEGTKNSSSRYLGSSWITLLGIAGLLFVLASPLLISEAIGGWTRQYTSPVYFTPSRSIPNLSGKVALVTGANTGIGYETALELARHGAHVIVAARSAQKGQAAIERIEKELHEQSALRPKLDFLKLDLSSLAAVEESAKEFLKWNLPLHMLVLNAGVMKSPGAEFIGKPMKYGFETTQDGLEYHIGVNHVAHFHLTQLLLQKLQSSAPSRVVAVSSLAEQGSYVEGMVFDDWIPENGQIPENYEDGNAYGQSKLANLLFAKELAARLEGTNVTAYSLHPGVIHTDLGRYMDPVIQEQLNEQGWLQRILSTAFFGIFRFAMMDSKVGAFTQLHVATADADTLVNGGFYHPIGKVAPSNHPQGGNQTLQTMLWQETERVIAKLRGASKSTSA